MSKRGVLRSSKKAMSPLIATVLLIAFAVAIGAMIMNWSSSIGDEEVKKIDCSTVSLVVNPYFCYAEQMIKMSVKNTGSPIKGLSLRVTDDNAQNDITLKNSAAKTGDIIKKDIPYIKTGMVYVGLIPDIQIDEEIVSCEKAVLETDDLPECQIAESQ